MKQNALPSQGVFVYESDEIGWFITLGVQYLNRLKVVLYQLK